MKYKLSETTKCITYKNKVILGSRETGQWLRISAQSYEVIQICIENNLDSEDLLARLYDDEDRQYVQELLNKMEAMRIIKAEGGDLRINKDVSWEITHRCNLQCIHCCIDAVNAVGNDIFDTNEVIKILDKIILWEPGSITLSGGEPLVRNDIIKILEYLSKNYSGKVVLCTNATLIRDENARMISKLVHRVDISIDGVDEESCAIIRGPGVFNRVINSISLLQKYGMTNIDLSMVLCDKNRHLKEAFFALNEQLGTRPLIRGFSAVGRGKDNILKLMDPEHELLFIPEDYINLGNPQPLQMCSCNAGTREIFIDYLGDIYPCPTLNSSRFKIDNIIQIESLNILENYRLSKCGPYAELQELEPDLNKKCSGCPVNLFCWTCLSDFDFHLGNDQSVFEQRCSMLKPVLFKKAWNEVVI